MKNFAKSLQYGAVYHFTAWLSRNRDSYPRWIIITAAAYIVTVGGAITLTALSPNAGEIIAGFFIRLSFFLNLTLAAGACLLLVAALAWNFGKGINIQFVNVQASLLPSQTGVDIAPDVFVLSEANESADEYAARLADVAKGSTATRWIVSIPFRSPILTMFADEAYTYERDEEIFARANWPGFDGRVVPSGTTFLSETPAQYAEYVRRFAEIYREWAPRKKAELASGSRKTIEILSGAVSVFLLLFLSACPLSAQTKTQQVSAMFGGRIGVPEAGQQIMYELESGKAIDRIGDGRSNYVELLKKVPGYIDQGGKVVAVWNGTACMARAGSVERVNLPPASTLAPSKESGSMGYYTPSQTGDPARPRMLTGGGGSVEPAGGAGLQPIDSLEMARQAEQVKEMIGFYHSEIWRAVRPWWGVVMFVFWFLVPIGAVAGSVCWFLAAFASSEGMIDVHKASRRALVYIVGAAASVLMVNIPMTMVYNHAGPGWIIFVCIIQAALAYNVAKRLVPNFQPAPGNSPFAMARGGRQAYLEQ